MTAPLTSLFVMFESLNTMCMLPRMSPAIIASPFRIISRQVIAVRRTTV